MNWYKMKGYLLFTGIFMSISVGGGILMNDYPTFGSMYFIGLSFYAGHVSRDGFLKVFFPHRYQTIHKLDTCKRCYNYIEGVKL